MFYVACGVHNIELLEPDSILCRTTGKAFFNNAEMLAVCRHTADLTWTARMLRAARIVGIAANSRVHTIFQLCQSRSKQSWNCCVACNSQSFLCAIRCTARMRRTSRQRRTRMSVASHSPAVFAFNNNKKQNTISESMSWDCHYASHSTRCRRSFLYVSLPVSLYLKRRHLRLIYGTDTLGIKRMRCKLSTQTCIKRHDCFGQRSCFIRCAAVDYEACAGDYRIHTTSALHCQAMITNSHSQQSNQQQLKWLINCRRSETGQTIPCHVTHTVDD